MPTPAAPEIKSYHAHVYYTPDTRDRAGVIRQQVEEKFEIVMGRWRDKPVGPHPMWSYQIAFEPSLFGTIIPWLALYHDDLPVFIHPNTGYPLADHRDHAIWVGEQQVLELSRLPERSSE